MATTSLLQLAFLATLLQHTLADTATTTTPQSTFSTSIIQATHYGTGYAATATPSNIVDSAGGGEGTDSGSFNLSTGGLIAIIVVVVAVAIFGIASIVLYVLAKRRQWNVPASIKRASRRLTGRSGRPGMPRKGTAEAAKRKRSGIAAPNGTPRVGGGGREQKRGVVVEVQDDVTGPLDYGTRPKTRDPKENTWVGRLWGNDWK